MSDTVVASNEVVANVETVAGEVQASTNLDFLSAISDEYKLTGNIKDFKDINQMAKSYNELQKMVGSSVRIPPKDASEESRQEFLNKIKDIDGVILKSDEKLYDKLGRPATAEDYKLSEVVREDLRAVLKPEVDAFQATAHKIGLTSDQAKQLLDMRMQDMATAEAKALETRTKSAEALKTLWGQDYDNRLAAAKQVVDIYGEKFGDDVAALVNSPAGNNPALLHMLSELASVYKEKGHEGMSGTDLGVTPDMARSQISDKRRDIGFMKAYNNAKDPGHDKAVKELEGLYRLL